MNRRAFLLSTSAVAASQAIAQTRKTAIYRLDYYHLQQGSQAGRLNDFLSVAAAVLAKNATAVGVFTSVVGGHLPLTLLLSGHASLEELEAAERTGQHQAALRKMEEAAEPPYEHLERVLLRPTAFSPEIAPLKEKPAKPRVFELRVYHAPTQRQLGYVHDRFAGPEIPIFHKSGIHPVLYADTIAGPQMPNLTYLTPFADFDAREKAWDAFGADPDWIKARAASIERGGQIVADMTVTLLRPLPFSPMQ
jgi:NIPSNAP